MFKRQIAQADTSRMFLNPKQLQAPPSTSLETFLAAQFNISFDDQKWRMGVNFNKSGSMTMGDAKYILPTDAGIPVFLRLSSHSSFSLKGSAGITVKLVAPPNRTNVQKKK